MATIKGFSVGDLQTNCYIIHQNNKALIVDPGAETERIKDEIEELNVQPLAVLLTHTHYDHIGSLDDIRQAYELEAYVSPLEQEWLQKPKLNLSAGGGRTEVITEPCEHEFEDYQTYRIENFEFQVVPTPGHSPGSVSFIFEESQFVICGDALFKGSIGRTDLPQANLHTLKNSIRRELFTLPEDYDVYPGHRGPTTVGDEKRTNPFFN